MNRKLLLQFVLFLMLTLFATYRMGQIQDLISGDKNRAAREKLSRKFVELEAIKKTELAMYTRLDEALATLTGASEAYLPDATDPYAWATRQVIDLGQRSGLRIEHTEAGSAPEIRSHRNEDTRQFSIYRCTVEFTGTLDQMLSFARIAEERNPHLIVSGFLIGPERDPNHVRYGNAVLDWPIWKTTELPDELLSNLDPLSDPPPQDAL